MRRCEVLLLSLALMVTALSSACGTSAVVFAPAEVTQSPYISAHGVMGKPLRVADAGFGHNLVITVKHCYWPVRIQSSDLLGAQIEVTITNRAPASAAKSSWEDVSSSFELRAKNRTPVWVNSDPIAGSIVDVLVKPRRTVTGTLFFNSGVEHRPAILSLQLNADEAAATWRLQVTSPD